jgi:hypothetical protein
MFNERVQILLGVIMDAIVIAYTAYLGISIALTIWVASTLYKNGIRFLIDAMNGDQNLAHSLNHLLVVGFYLVNLGFVALNLKTSQAVDTSRQVIEMVSTQIGWVLVILGFMHFFNLLVFNKIRRAKTGEKLMLQGK